MDYTPPDPSTVGEFVDFADIKSNKKWVQCAHCTDWFPKIELAAHRSTSADCATQYLLQKSSGKKALKRHSDHEVGKKRVLIEISNLPEFDVPVNNRACSSVAPSANPNPNPSRVIPEQDAPQEDAQPDVRERAPTNHLPLDVNLLDRWYGCRQDFDKCPWEVTLREEAKDAFGHLAKDIVRHLLQLLLKLAQGDKKTLTESRKGGIQVHIKDDVKVGLSQLEVGKYAMLWAYGIDFSVKVEHFTEIIRVYDIVHLDSPDFEKKRDSIAKEIAATGQLFTKLKMPRGEKDSTHRLPRVLETCGLEIDDVAMVGSKYFTLSADMLHALYASEQEEFKEMEFPIRISANEGAIITKNGPVVVIGRSGSGKTLCCVYRLWLQYIGYWRLSDGSKLYQSSDLTQSYHHNAVFLTHSSPLVGKVLEYFYSLHSTAKRWMSIPEFSPKKRIPDTLHDLHDFPLFCTFRKLLVMIDGTLDTYFLPRTREMHVDESQVAFSIAPDGANAFRADYARGKSVMREVDYDDFFERYWPKLRIELPCISAALVWREFLSCIKGSWHVLTTMTGHLSAEKYEGIGKKCALAPHRAQIYKAFELYEKIKKAENGWDRIDFAYHVVSNLHRHHYTGPPVHSLMVDEVQDLSQMELAVLLYVSKPESLFLVGDTSQTVSRAIDFRFADLRSLFTMFTDTVPEISQLTVNYRSHTAILLLSNFIVKIIEKCFPHSIDRLVPDEGHRDGCLPIVANDISLDELENNVLKDQEEGATPANSTLFGATQVILVRNDISKDAVSQKHKKALVMTVEESKGLEFDDVFLYNFFTDSSYKEWDIMKRVRSLVDSDTQDACTDTKTKKPAFDSHRHAILCSELKHLYTAVTRTRHILIVFEDNETKGAAMLKWLVDSKLCSEGFNSAENMVAQHELRERCLGSKGVESWNKTGESMFKLGIYDQAMRCFQNAGDEEMVAACEGFLCAREAQRDTDKKKSLFLEAADKFKAAGDNHMKLEAECRRNGGQNELAGKLFAQCEDWKDAGYCYHTAKKYLESGNYFLKAEYYENALDAYMELETPDTLYGKKVVKTILACAERAIKVAKDRDVKDLVKYIRERLSEKGLREESGTLLLNQGHFEDALICFEECGNTRKVVECLKQSGTQDNRMKAAVRLEQEDPKESAEIYEELKDIRKAAELLDTIAEKDESAARKAGQLWEELHEHLRAGLAYEYCELYADAMDMFDHCGRLDCQARVCRKIADGNMGTGPWTDALQLYEQAQCWNPLADMLAQEGKYSDAIRNVNKKPILTKEDYADLENWYTKCPQLWKEATIVFMGCEKWEIALKFSRKPEVLSPGDRRNVARCLNELGRYMEAANELVAKKPVENIDACKAFCYAQNEEDEKARNKFFTSNKKLIPNVDEDTLKYFVKHGAFEIVKKELSDMDRIAVDYFSGRWDFALKTCCAVLHTWLEGQMQRKQEIAHATKEWESLKRQSEYLQLVLQCQHELGSREHVRYELKHDLLRAKEKLQADERLQVAKEDPTCKKIENLSALENHCKSVGHQAFQAGSKQEKLMLAESFGPDINYTFWFFHIFTWAESSAERKDSFYATNYKKSLRDRCYAVLKSLEVEYAVDYTFNRQGMMQLLTLPDGFGPQLIVALTCGVYRLLQRSEEQMDGLLDDALDLYEHWAHFPQASALRHAMRVKSRNRHVEAAKDIVDALEKQTVEEILMLPSPPALKEFKHKYGLELNIVHRFHWAAMDGKKQYPYRKVDPICVEIKAIIGFLALPGSPEIMRDKQLVQDAAVALWKLLFFPAQDSDNAQLTDHMRARKSRICERDEGVSVRRRAVSAMHARKNEFAEEWEHMSEMLFNIWDASGEATEVVVADLKALRGEAGALKYMLEKLKSLLGRCRPICPYRLQFGPDMCDGRCGGDEFFTHPKHAIGQNPWMLFGYSHSNHAAFGLGLQAWYDLGSTCGYWDCRQGDKCHYRHLEKESGESNLIFPLKNKRIKWLPKKIPEEFFGTLTDVYLNADRYKCPNGFGLVFFKDEALEKDIRRLLDLCNAFKTVVSTIFRGSQLGKLIQHAVLACFRYPHPQIIPEAVKIFNELRYGEDFRPAREFVSQQFWLDLTDILDAQSDRKPSSQGMETKPVKTVEPNQGKGHGRIQWRNDATRTDFAAQQNQGPSWNRAYHKNPAPSYSVVHGSAASYYTPSNPQPTQPRVNRGWKKPD